MAAPRVLPGDVVVSRDGGRDHLAVNAGPKGAQLLEVVAALSPDQSIRIHIPHVLDDLGGRAPVGGGEDLDGRDHVLDGGGEVSKLESDGTNLSALREPLVDQLFQDGRVEPPLLGEVEHRRFDEEGGPAFEGALS